MGVNLRLCGSSVYPLYLFLALATGQTAEVHGTWVRHAVSGKGDLYTPIKRCYPLKYFTEDPYRFDHERAFSRDKNRPKPLTELKYIGQIDRFKLYDVVHIFDPDSPARGWIKMILVNRGPGEFCEIYHLESSDVFSILKPTFMVPVGDRQILATRSRVTGNGASYDESYYVFDRDGPIELKVHDAIAHALRTILPPGKEIRKGYGFNITRLCYAMPVWNEHDDANSTAGSVYMKLALRGNELMITTQRYDPTPREAPYSTKRCPILE